MSGIFDMTRRTNHQPGAWKTTSPSADHRIVRDDAPTTDMPLRSATPSGPATAAFPPHIFSTAYGMTIHMPGHDKSAVPANLVKKKSYIIIKSDVLIPGDGEPLSNAALVMENKLIAWVGPQDDIPEKYSSAPHRAYAVACLMPGLWDCHTHFGGDSPTGDDGPGYTPIITSDPATVGARLARGCWEALQRGYTSLRDVGGYGCEVAKAISDGTIVGPNIYSAGAALSQTAGHGDVFNLPAGVVYQNLGVSQVTPGHFGKTFTCIVDGVDECRRGVRLQIRRGAKTIKILASGGVLSRDDDVRRAQFSDEELRVMVEEAARQGRCVAAHVHNKPGILAAVRAGVTTVEHVSLADQECIDLIKEKGVICVFARFINEYLLRTGGQGLDPSSWEKAKYVGAHHLEAYQRAVRSGVTVALGTDTAPGSNVAIELEFAVQAGLSQLEAIKAATVNAAKTVGPQAPKTAQLKAGYEADVLGLTANPAEDVRVLQDQANIQYVWKGGKIYKGPGVSPWGEDPWYLDDPTTSGIHQCR